MTNLRAFPDPEDPARKAAEDAARWRTREAREALDVQDLAEHLWTWFQAREGQSGASYGQLVHKRRLELHDLAAIVYRLDDKRWKRTAIDRAVTDANERIAEIGHMSREDMQHPQARHRWSPVAIRAWTSIYGVLTGYLPLSQAERAEFDR